MASFRQNRNLATLCFSSGLILAMGFGVLWIQGDREKEAEGVAVEEEDVEPQTQGWVEQTLASWSSNLNAPPVPQKPERVVIVFIQRPEAVEELRKVVDASSLVFSDEEAIAMSNGRIVATDHDAASKVLNTLQWIDLPLEMWDRASLGQRMGQRMRGVIAASGGNGSLSEGERARYSELSNKAELSYMESRQILQFMEKTGEI
jgi:hypothetical protein